MPKSAVEQTVDILWHPHNVLCVVQVRNRESMVFSIKGCVHSEIIISPIAFHYETTQIPDYLKIKILENDAQIMRGSNPVMTIEQQDLMR